MKHIKKYLISAFIMLFSLGFLGAATKAAFQSNSSVSDVTFKVGDVDLKLLEDLSQGPSTSNLVETKGGLTFDNIFAGWERIYPLKLYNKGSLPILVKSNSAYETANDPASLREYIFVEVYPWDDANGDGAVDSEEVGASIGKKTILKWKTEGFTLGEVLPGKVLGSVLKFSLPSLPDTKMGQQAKYTFEFSGTLGLDN